MNKFVRVCIVTIIFVTAFSVINILSGFSPFKFVTESFTVGIRQKGIKNTAPQMITNSGYKLIQTFMTSTEKTFFKRYYSEEITEDSDPNEISGRFIRRECNPETLNRLNSIFDNAVCTFFYTMQDSGEYTGIEIKTGDINLNELYLLQPTFSGMTEIVADARKKMIRSNESDVKQNSISFSQKLLEDAGLDTRKIQSDYIARRTAVFVFITVIIGVAAVLLWHSLGKPDYVKAVLGLS